MAQITSVYKCEKCGKVVEIVGLGDGELTCDNEPMVLQDPQDGPLGEKHIPIVERTKKGFLVKVSTVTHPMTPEHSIRWIQLEVDGILHRAQLLPTNKPEFEFEINSDSDKYIATAYCNVHGLWDNLSVVGDQPMIDDRIFSRTDFARYWRD